MAAKMKIYAIILSILMSPLSVVVAGDPSNIDINVYFTTDLRVDADFEFDPRYQYVRAELYNLDEGTITPEQPAIIQLCCGKTITFTNLSREDLYLIRLGFSGNGGGARFVIESDPFIAIESTHKNIKSPY